MTATVDILEPDYPFPPRFGRTKRIVLISILVACAYVGVMWWLRSQARSRLEAHIQAIHARGEPVLPEDFQTPYVSDDSNAAYSLGSAFKSRKLSQAQSDFLDSFDLDEPLDDKGRQLLGQIAQSSAQARQLARRARFQDSVDWNVRYRPPVISVLLPHLSPQRQLARTLTRIAEHEHLAGNDAEAIEIARDIVRQANLLHRDNPAFVTHLVAMGNAAEACNLVRVLSYDLQVFPDAQATTQPTGPASRKQVQALIKELLDDTDQSRGYVTSLQVERMMEYDLAKNPMSIGVWGPEMRPILEALYRPIFDLDAIRIMENTTKVAKAGQADHWRAAQAAIPNGDKLLTRQTTATGATRLLSLVIMPSFNRAVLNQYRNRALRRVAALRLAIRLYQIDHDGQFPQTLEQLVPAYIAAVPLDPFCPSG